MIESFCAEILGTSLCNCIGIQGTPETNDNDDKGTMMQILQAKMTFRKIDTTCTA